MTSLPNGARREVPGARSTADSRGQATALEFSLSLAIASLVVVGLVTAAGGFVDDRRDRVVRTELSVVGQQLAGELTAADRLVQAGETKDVRVTKRLPSTVAGTRYTIEVESTGSVQWVNLTADGSTASASVRVDTETDLASTRVKGGTVTIVYDGSRLEVRS